MQKTYRDHITKEEILQDPGGGGGKKYEIHRKTTRYLKFL